AVAIPGYQVPFGSRELPIGRGWGTGGIQITLSVIGREDTLKVIDQGSDDSVNAVSIREFVSACTGVKTTTDSEEATVIQTRHRIPEIPLRNDQIMVLQVPLPEALRLVEPLESVTKQMHAEMDYAPIWLALYENIVRVGEIELGADYPVMVEDRYIMMPSPIPRFDNPKLNNSPALYLFGAGREKKIYALPPYTKAESLCFEDHPFRVEDMSGRVCRLCGARDVYMDEFFDSTTGEKQYQCSDSGYCEKRRKVKDTPPSLF
ncbi:MAG: alpha-D-ribose 1-methylphosphonate 5-phosphate C-P-lyase PhnJ, partial [Treponema sp.]|nr:alpha-D-ribose 1-methylphosphonate 5-phosphate C-P-lyase PhnJ [Treponema sp.]